MKKKLLSLMLTLLLILPCAFGFTACANRNGGNGPSTSAKITGIEVIVKDNFDSPNYYSCTYDGIVGNKEACTMDEIKVYYTYSDGKRKELKEDEYNYKKYVDGAFYSPTPFQFMLSGESSDSAPGKHIMRFYSNTGKYTADLVVEILRMQRPGYTCATYLNEYTDLQRTEVNKTNMLGEEKFVEIDFMQDVFSDFPCFFTTSATGLKENEITHLILKYSEEYYSDPDSYIKAENIVGYHKGLKFCAKDDSYLTPGDYLLIPSLPESRVYLSDFGDAVKIRILPYEFETATKAISGKQSDYTYNSIDFMFNETKSKTGSPFNIGGGRDSAYTAYVKVDYFESGVWKSKRLSQCFNELVKVHAYKDENGFYHLADYIDGEWYKHNSTTKLNSSDIKYISHTLLQENLSESTINSQIFLSIDSSGWSDAFKQLVKEYPVFNNRFAIPLEIDK